MNILLVDDHTLFREGMKFLLARLDAKVTVIEAATCVDALAAAQRARPDLVLLDLKMPGVAGLDALAQIREALPGAPVVVLSGEDNPRTIRAAIDAGAMGFIPKAATPEILVQALRIVLAHGIYLPPQVLAPDAPPSGPLFDPASTDPVAKELRALTERQRLVLKMAIQGESNKAIARTLDIAEGTVKAHLSAVMRALGVRNRTEAVFAAARFGLRLD
jgi:DNA-binding NarL/FixJ family response regulator